MVFGVLNRWFGHARVKSRDVSGVVVLGGNEGIIVQNIGTAPPPEPLVVGWAEALPPQDAPGRIFNLLHWKTRLVPELICRAAEMQDLLSWAMSGPKLSIRFLHGPGGAGKTRLAAELARSLPTWTAGFAPLEKQTRLPLSPKGLLAILDYPEDWREQVRALLRQAGRLAEPPAPIRLLLLSRRSPHEWWSDMVDCGATHLCTAQEVRIGPLETSAAAALFQATVARLEAYYGQRAPIVDKAALRQWLERRPDLHPLALLTIAAAIHFVFEPGATLGLDAAEIVSALVDRERRRIDGAGRSSGWGSRGASRLMGLAALREHGLDEPAIRRLANPALEIGFPPAGSPLEAARTLDGWQADQLIAPRPDIIAAELLRQTLLDAGGRGGEWMWETLADEGAAQPELFGRRIHDLATLHGPADNTLLAAFGRAIAERPERAQNWHAFLESDAGGFRLSRAGVMVGQVLLNQSHLPEDYRAIVLNNLSVHLSDAGEGAGALAAIREAADIRRRLAQANPAHFETDLATSLNNLSNRLSDAGDGAGALAAILEAADIYRRLAQANPARFEPDLAMSLNNLSNRLSDAGDGAGALAAIREAADIRRRLAQANPARFEPDLAMSLNNLSNRLSDAGDGAGTLAAIREATDIYRRLAQANPARFEPDLAMSVNNLSVRLSDAGDGVGGLAAIWEAADIYRRLTQANPASFEPDLAGSLNNLSNQLSDVGDDAGALAAIREAVDIRRRLAQANPARFEPDLARSLNNLSNRLSDAGDGAGALAAIREAADIRRRLAQANPARFEPDLATSLNNMSLRLSDAGDGAGALAAIREAADIYRRLAQANPARFSTVLEQSLRNLDLIRTKYPTLA